MLDTPVLFLVFNRPYTTAKVFEAIRQVRPKQLFIAADGPRKDRPDDSLKCSQVREIVGKVDWECEVETLFREANLGCGRAVSEGISWFFENVEEGIILEDDTLPDQSFFWFCEELLGRYRYEERVMHIGGSNTSSYFPSYKSYHFSKTATIWGWATWRRAWQLYDYRMRHLQSFLESDSIKTVSSIQSQQKIHIDNLKSLFEKSIDTWDYQWTFSIWHHNALAIVSGKNLVTNIGFGADATHTKTDAHNELPYHSIDVKELNHPIAITLDKEFDEYIFRSNMGGNPSLVKKISGIIRKSSQFIKELNGK